MGITNMVNIMFASTPSTSIGPVQRGVVGLMLQDQASVVGTYTVTRPKDLIEDDIAKLSEDNKLFIKMALHGAENAPTAVKVVVTELVEAITWDPAKQTEAFAQLEALDADYIAFPGISSSDAAKVTEWVKDYNKDAVHRVKVVLADLSKDAGDNDHIINYVHESATWNGKAYTAVNFTPYVAGFIASTDPTRSITYQLLRNVTNATKLSSKKMDDHTKKGELVLAFNGREARFVSGVNSLQTPTDKQDDAYKQIKVIEIQDMFYNAVKKAILEKYIGKYTNTYQHKLLLVAEINRLFQEFERAGLLEPGDSFAEVDVEAQRDYLYKIDYVSRSGKKVEAMSRDEILRANTREKVFIHCRMKPLGAIEAVDILVNT